MVKLMIFLQELYRQLCDAASSYSYTQVLAVGLLAGAVVGGYIPMVFGEPIVSVSSFVGSVIGGGCGLYVAHRIR